jgi:SAM-dependent methyltransferase
VIDKSDQHEYGAWLNSHEDVLQPGLFALDLGCGLGNDTRTLIARGMSVVGLDVSRQRVRRASGNVPGGMFVIADLARGLPFQTGSFDLVVASLSLHYFDAPTTDAIVRDITRVLRENGVLLTRVNTAGDVASGYGAGIEVEPDLFEVEPGRLKRFFTEETLRELLCRSLEVEAIERQVTLVRGQQRKQTLVARARCYATRERAT